MKANEPPTALMRAESIPRRYEGMLGFAFLAALAAMVMPGMLAYALPPLEGLVGDVVGAAAFGFVVSLGFPADSEAGATADKGARLVGALVAGVVAYVLRDVLLHESALSGNGGLVLGIGAYMIIGGLVGLLAYRMALAYLAATDEVSPDTEPAIPDEPATVAGSTATPRETSDRDVVSGVRPRVGDRIVVQIDTLLLAPIEDGWQALSVARGSEGVVVAEEAAGWDHTVRAERLSGGLVTLPGAISVWLEGREYGVPNSMIAAGQVIVCRRGEAVEDPVIGPTPEGQPDAST